MELCLFILAISFVVNIASIIIFKNAINIRLQIEEQAKEIADEPEIFLEFFK